MDFTIMKWILSFAIFFSATSSAQTLYPGIYRWQIDRTDGEQIVFISKVFDNGKKMFLINGKDTMLVDDIRPVSDSIRIELPFFESSFMAKADNHHNLSGYWIKKSGGIETRRMPFTAQFGVSERFSTTSKPRVNITGEWTTTFTSGTKETKAAGEFVQKGNYLTGTFRTPYGDYRFLEGIVTGDSIYLSGFDGSMALLFKGRISKGRIEGDMYSANTDKREWHSVRGKSELPDDLTRVKPGADRLNFTFPDFYGKKVSISDPQYRNKVVVLQIMGSWCPNCLDEMKFISENYNRYKAMGVEFIALAYERTDNFRESQKALSSFFKKIDIPYPVLIPPVSVSDEHKTEKTIPQIEDITVFPTTIFVDKSGHIAKITTGFDGPATGVHYLRHQEDFENTLKHLVEQ